MLPSLEVRTQDGTSPQTLLTFFFNHLAWHKHLHTEKHTDKPQTNWHLPIPVPSCCESSRIIRYVPLYCFWFASVFGLAFQGLLFNSCFWLFVCLFFFCQDSLFLYLIKIWKLNFHSIFSNHLIKISSTTTKKIRSSRSKLSEYVIPNEYKH